MGLGQALLCGEDMYMSALRGRGIGVLHLMEDALWYIDDYVYEIFMKKTFF